MRKRTKGKCEHDVLPNREGYIYVNDVNINKIQTLFEKNLNRFSVV